MNKSRSIDYYCFFLIFNINYTCNDSLLWRNTVLYTVLIDYFSVAVRVILEWRILVLLNSVALVGMKIISGPIGYHLRLSLIVI